jgi:predicted site-specific integrase-resolvase
MPAAAPTTPTILRRREAAERLGVHPNTLASWVQRGWLAGVTMPSGEVRYREEDIEALRRRIYAQ